MCGIVGFAGRAGGERERQASLRAMCAAIVHRGPDEEGRYLAPDVALGMRRLSVMDPAMGQQPMTNEDGSIQLVFNGEIYNHRQLRRELVGRGHVLTTSSDTEVIVHLYEELGDAVVDALRGMFAFALWDTRRQRLLIARDRVGIKPLHYWEHAGGLAFASELRSMLAMPDFTARVNAQAVAQYLTFGYVPETHCIFEGVRKLPPGHRLTWEPSGALQIERYWSPLRAERTDIDDREAVDALRTLLRESVALHLESDVPLGAFLSGGIDSSAIAALMSGMVAQRGAARGTRRARDRHRPHGADRSAGCGQPRGLRDHGIRRAVRRPVGAADVPRVADGARARDGRAVGRWRRRAVRRLHALYGAALAARAVGGDAGGAGARRTVPAPRRSRAEPAARHVADAAGAVRRHGCHSGRSARRRDAQ